MGKSVPATMEVICGSMFCGKTEELIRRLRRAIIAKNHVQVFKPVIDDRYVVEKVYSHAGIEIDANPLSEITELYNYLHEDTTVVGIDEAQFFGPEIVDIAMDLVDNRGIRVILAGLDQDFRGEPFGSMPTLMALAERVDKLNAICMVCGGPATRTQRLVDGKPAHYNDPLVIVGTSEMYEARCRKHHEVPGKPGKQ